MTWKIEMILGGLGGVIGLIMGNYAWAVGVWGGNEIGGILAIIFSIIGIVGAISIDTKIINIETKTAGYMMIGAAILGYLAIGSDYILPAILFIIAGIFALFKKDKKMSKWGF